MLVALEIFGKVFDQLCVQKCKCQGLFPSSTRMTQPSFLDLLIRYDSPFKEKTPEWRSSRSSSAVVITLSPIISAQVSKLLLEVTMTETFPYFFLDFRFLRRLDERLQQGPMDVIFIYLGQPAIRQILNRPALRR